MLARQSVQNMAIQISGQINKAYSTLVDPLSRAQHLVSPVRALCGRGETQQSAERLPILITARPFFLTQLELYGNPVEETDSLTDPELLMEILEAREGLEEASSEDEMEVVRAKNTGEKRSLGHCFSLCLAAPFLGRIGSNPPSLPVLLRRTHKADPLGAFCSVR